jgi:hypothetical protein
MRQTVTLALLQSGMQFIALHYLGTDLRTRLMATK